LIARALASDPDIVLFDEATSALDNITQAMVVKTLEEMECTRIVIAHRLSTIKRCSRIVYLDKGKVVEEGTYDELMALGGRFAELANRQIV
jgi:ABC-type multidrug transport system fused ATPase/permease subunit